MDELQQIKLRVYQEDKIEDVLELLGCWNIDTEQHGLLYVAGLPDGDNPRSVQIKNNESLTCNIRSKGVTGSIYDLISYIIFDANTEDERKSALPKSKHWLCEKLHYYEYIDSFYKETSDFELIKPNATSWLNKFKAKKKSSVTNDVRDNEILDQYSIIPYKKWYEEGLTIKTQKYFGVGIDVQSERVTFPIHNKDGELIGVKGRYCGRNSEIEQNYKYLYVVPCNKSIELYNFHRALPHIKRLKEVIIFEGAKSTWFATQWGHPNSVSMEGDKLSDEQIKLLKSLGIDIKFVFAYDKDKSKEFVKNEVSRLTGRMKHAILDTSNLLVDKDSPIDKGLDVWKRLYTLNNYRVN